MKPIKAWGILQIEDDLHQWFHLPGIPFIYPTRERARTAARNRRKQSVRDLGLCPYRSIRPVRVTITVDDSKERK